MRAAVRAKVPSLYASSVADMVAVASEFGVKDTVVHRTPGAWAPRRLGEGEEHLASRLWYQWMQREMLQVVVEGAHTEKLVLA